MNPRQAKKAESDENLRKWIMNQFLEAGARTGLDADDSR